MIKEKYKWYISIISMGLAVVLTSKAMFYSNRNVSDKTVLIKTEQTVLNKEEVTNISIDINKDDWKWLIENATNEEFKSCNITVNGETYYNVGIRPKGNTSLTNVASDDTTDRYSFKIKFNEYVSGQTYNGIESIVLNNIIQDNTYIKEYVAYDLYSKLGVATPEMSYSNITINGEVWGLYLAIEVIDERYLECNFGTNEGNLYKPETMGVGGGNKNGDKIGGMENHPPMNGSNQMDEPPNMNGDNMMVGMPNMQNNQYMGDFREDMQGSMETGNNQEIPNMPPNMQNQNNDNKQVMNSGGERPTEGADFIYIDDNVSSYSIVRDSAVLKRTSDSDFKRVINMYKNLQDGTNLEEVLDVEEVLKYFAVNTYVINLDSYSGEMYHNYYLYEKNGKCQILPWDLNLSFGGYGIKNGNRNKGNTENISDNNSVQSIINFPIDNPVTGDLDNMPLIGKLLEVEEYKELYHAYLKQIADEYFNSGYYENLVNKLDNLIDDYVKEDPTAFCTYDEYKTAIKEMITFGEDRTTSILAQLSGEQPSTTYGNIQSTVNISAMGDMGGRMRKGDNGNIQNQNNENINPEAMQKPQGNKEGLNNPQNDKNKQMKPMENKNNNMRENMNYDKMREMVQNNQNNMKNYLIIVGLFVVGILGIVFISKFKRKSNQ